MFKKIAILAVLGLAVSGCTIARSMDAGKAKEEMVGMARLELLACAGIPTAAWQEGRTEVFSYNVVGGNVVHGGSVGAARVNTFGNNADVYGGQVGVSKNRIQACQVTFTLHDGAITRVAYRGQGEGLLVPNSQCEPVIRNCIAP